MLVAMMGINLWFGFKGEESPDGVYKFKGCLLGKGDRRGKNY